MCIRDRNKLEWTLRELKTSFLFYTHNFLENWFSTHKTILQNKQYHFYRLRSMIFEKALQWSISQYMIKKNILFHTNVSSKNGHIILLLSGKLQVHASLINATVTDGVYWFSFSQHWNFYIPKVSRLLEFHGTSLSNKN